MAGAEIRRPCETGKCDDDSPPVCLVQLNNSRLFTDTPDESTEEKLNSSKGLVGVDDPSKSTASLSPSVLNVSPEVSRMGNSTPDKLTAGDEVSTTTTTSDIPIEEQSNIGNREISFGDIDDRPISVDSESHSKSDSLRCSLGTFPSIQLASCQQPVCSEENGSNISTATSVTLTATTDLLSKGDQVHSSCSQSAETSMTIDVLPSSNVRTFEDPGTGANEFDDEMDDFEDRPLTVDVPQESDMEVPVSKAHTDVCPTAMEHSSVDPTGDCPDDLGDKSPKTDQLHLSEATANPVEVTVSTETVSCATPRATEQVIDQSGSEDRVNSAVVEKPNTDIKTAMETRPDCVSPSNRNTSSTQIDSRIEVGTLGVTSTTTGSTTNLPCHPISFVTSNTQSDDTTTLTLEPSCPSASEPSIADESAEIGSKAVTTTTTTTTTTVATSATATSLASSTVLPVTAAAIPILKSSSASTSTAALNTATTTVTTTSSTPPLSVAFQSTVQLTPFVATVSTAYPGPTAVLNNLAGSGGGHGGNGCIPTAIPLAGAPGAGPGSLQIFNMTPMPQFVGAPGIVLHATGPVAGTPGFQSSTPLLSGLPTVGATPGLGVSTTTTLNFLQPQPFATTLLPHSGSTATDYLLDPQNTLGLAQSHFPSSSIALFNPVNPGTVMDSMTATPLSTLYPTLIPPPPPSTPTHSQPMLSASSTASASSAPISTSLFVPPPLSYRPSMGGVTNLVNATTPQMATSLGTGPSPSPFPPIPSMSLGASNPGGFLFQTSNHPLISSPGPLLQSCQFPSYPMPFQNPDQCLPLNPGLSSNLSGFRPTDQVIETPVSSSANLGLPQLWAASSPFPSVPFSPNSFQPLTFPSITTTTVSSPAGGSGGANLLPQPPTLQPCPALSKRLHRLYPVPVSRGTAPMPNTSASSVHSPTRRSPALAVRPTLVASTAIADKRPVLASCPTGTIGAQARQLQTVPSLGVKLVNTLPNVGIRTPNSIAVIPSLRRRRPLTRTNPKTTAKAEEIPTASSTHSSCAALSSSEPESTVVDKITVPTDPTAVSDNTDRSESTTHAPTQSNPMIRKTSAPSSPSSSQALPTDTSTPVPLSNQPTSSDQRLPGVHVFPNQAAVAAPTSSNDLVPTTNTVQQKGNETSSDTESLLPKPIFDQQDKNERSSERSTMDTDTSLSISKEPHNPIASTLPCKYSQSTATNEVPVPETSIDSSSPSSNSSFVSCSSLIPPKSHSIQSPSISPSRVSAPSNGVQMRDSTELQASLERLGVSSVVCPTPPVTITNASVDTLLTNKDSCLRRSPLEATGLLPVSRGLTKPASAPTHANRSTFRLPPPLLHRGPDDRRILTHYIDGHVIYESNKPFPVKHGMAVVEAALLHQCIEEEQGYSDRITGQSESLQQSSLSAPVNGEEPMQIDLSSAVSPASSDSGPCPTPDKFTIKTGTARKSELPENWTTAERERQRRKPLPGMVCENGYPAERIVAPCEPSGDKISEVNAREKTEPSIRGQEHSSLEEGNPSRVKSLTETTIPPATPLPPPSFGVPRPDRKGLDPQQLSSRIPVSTNRTTLSSNQALISNTHMTPTNVAHSFSGIFSCHSHPGLQVPDPPPPGPVRYWSSEDVVAFVRGTPGCGAYAEAFLTNEIDGEALLLLAEDQFIQPPIGMKIGPALKLAARLETLRNAS